VGSLANRASKQNSRFGRKQNRRQRQNPTCNGVSGPQTKTEKKIRILARRGRTLCRRLGGENLRIDKTNGGQKSRLKLATRMRQWFKRDQKTQRDLRQKGKLKQQPQKYQRSFAHTKEWRQTSGRGKTEKGDRSLATRID
jgi:hypothetical protein